MNSISAKFLRLDRGEQRARSAEWLQRAISVGCAVLLASSVHAQPAPNEPASAQTERVRIAAERSRVDADFAAEQQRCFKRFAVNDCRNESRRRRDAARSVLRKGEVELNDAERARRAAVQRDSIEQRQQERQRRGAEAAPAPRDEPLASDRTEPARLVPRSAPSARSSGPSGPIAPRAKPREDGRERRATVAAQRAERVAQEASNVAQRERRLREATEHKAEVLKTDAARQQTAPPLPVPRAADPR